MARTTDEKMNDTRVTRSSGNVFADLGLPDAEDLLHKSDLVIGIKKIMERRKLTQTRVAEITGVDQPTLSKLFRGNFSNITVDRLLSMLTKLGHKVTIHVDDQAEPESNQAPLTVSFSHVQEMTAVV
jgi:predicted XRE-type DNA-binding protein